MAAQEDVVFGPMFGEFLLSQGRLSKDELAQAMEQLKRDNRRLGQFALEKGLISESQLDEALEKQSDQGKPVGKVLLELGYLTRAQLDDLLFDQLRSNSYLGETLLDMGLMEFDELGSAHGALRRLKDEQRKQAVERLEMFDAADIGITMLRSLAEYFKRVSRPFSFEGMACDAPSADGTERRSTLIRTDNGDSRLCELSVMAPSEDWEAMVDGSVDEDWRRLSKGLAQTMDAAGWSAELLEGKDKEAASLPEGSPLALRMKARSADCVFWVELRFTS